MIIALLDDIPIPALKEDMAILMLIDEAEDDNEVIPLLGAWT